MATNYNPFAKKYAEIVNGEIENYLDATIVTYYDKTTCSYMAHVWLEDQPVPIMFCIDHPRYGDSLPHDKAQRQAFLTGKTRHRPRFFAPFPAYHLFTVAQTFQSDSTAAQSTTSGSWFSGTRPTI